MRTGTIGSAGVVHYILSDHLGSSSVITDGAGAVVGSAKYYPYGTPRAATGAMQTDKLFTGQQREVSPPWGSSAGSTPWGTDLFLSNYGARFYSALTGRFVSPDPFVPDPSEPMKQLKGALTVSQPPGFADLEPPVPTTGDVGQNAIPTPLLLNRYGYTLDNPLRYTDPTGLCFWAGMECTPEIAYAVTVCAGVSVDECVRALGETGGLERALKQFNGDIGAFIAWIREAVQLPYFQEVSLPANDPMAAFIEQGPESLIGELFMHGNYLAFWSGRQFVLGVDFGAGPGGDLLSVVTEAAQRVAHVAGSVKEALTGECAAGVAQTALGLSQWAAGNAAIEAVVPLAVAAPETVGASVILASAAGIAGGTAIVSGIGNIVGGMAQISGGCS